jgi:threo-3-hydroxy-D-aspartate ammonia-lyase
LSGNNTRFRPHLKSAKCAKAAKIVTAQNFGGITASTLKEAEYFAASGFTDILYAVAIIPARFERAARLIKCSTKLQLLLDDPDVVTALNAFAMARGIHIQFLLEIDSDGHRNGLTPDAPRLAAIAQSLAGSGDVTIDGVLTHAGESYSQDAAAVIEVIAAHEAAHPEVAEYRAGVYMFMDLFQSNLRLCTHDDIAVTMLSSVIDHAPADNCTLEQIPCAAAHRGTCACFTQSCVHDSVCARALFCH